MTAMSAEWQSENYHQLGGDHDTQNTAPYVAHQAYSCAI